MKPQLPPRRLLTTIRPASRDDVSLLPEIELAAAARFKPYARVTGLTAAHLARATPLAQFQAAQADGLLWVAAQADRAIGFALLRRLPDSIYLQEMDVLPEHSGRGVGGTLLARVCSWSHAQRLPVTLITFRDVPWNAPFYRRCGFRILSPTSWSAPLRRIRQEERLRGWRIAARVAMRCAP
jgi:GNAT superfamily N-acetyltransferase